MGRLLLIFHDGPGFVHTEGGRLKAEAESDSKVRTENRIPMAERRPKSEVRNARPKLG
jgi:hypothetical protein